MADGSVANAGIAIAAQRRDQLEGDLGIDVAQEVDAFDAIAKIFGCEHGLNLLGGG